MLKILLRGLVPILIVVAFPCMLCAQGRVHAVVPESISQANRFYSPGVDAGDYVYISGQGPRKPDGSTPASFSEQVRQALDNVQAIVKSAGLTLDHIVYMQIYMEDTSKY